MNIETKAVEITKCSKISIETIKTAIREAPISRSSQNGLLKSISYRSKYLSYYPNVLNEVLKLIANGDNNRAYRLLRVIPPNTSPFPINFSPKAWRLAYPEMSKSIVCIYDALYKLNIRRVEKKIREIESIPTTSAIQKAIKADVLNNLKYLLKCYYEDR